MARTPHDVELARLRLQLRNLRAQAEHATGADLAALEAQVAQIEREITALDARVIKLESLALVGGRLPRNAGASTLRGGSGNSYWPSGW